jgi:hypothetical protein
MGLLEGLVRPCPQLSTQSQQSPCEKLVRSHLKKAGCRGHASDPIYEIGLSKRIKIQVRDVKKP